MGKIVIVDYGSQYTQLIARKTRDLRVFSEVVTATSQPNLEDISGLILSGGPFSVYDPRAPRIPDWVKPLIEKEVPILGICYGFQLLTQYFGGRVDRAHSSEYGRMPIVRQGENPLFDGIDRSLTVWMSHGDSVLELPPGFAICALSENEIIASAFHVKDPIYGLQFHPEVNHTEFGDRIFSNFLFKICRCTPDWTLKDFIAIERENLRATIGTQRAVCAVSGGVDSTVAAVLAHQAIGSQLTGVFVADVTGRRPDEARDVVALHEFGHIELHQGILAAEHESCQSLGQFRLAHTRRADHDDVLRGDLVAQVRPDILTPPAVAQRDRHGPLGLRLADDVPIELGDDLFRC